MKQHFNPENSRTAATSVPLEKLTRVLEGDKEREGKRTEGKGERSGRGKKKKSTKQALGRYSKAKNVLKTTC